MKIDYYLMPYIEINVKKNKDLNVRPETMELLGGKKSTDGMLLDNMVRFLLDTKSKGNKRKKSTSGTTSN